MPLLLIAFSWGGKQAQTGWTQDSNFDPKLPDAMFQSVKNHLEKRH